MDDIVFLTMEEVEQIHVAQLAAHGGQHGYISRGVVESAVAQPCQTMFGQYLHTDLAHMAAAYLFHLATTQGFMDGNKRTALTCALTFLEINGYTIHVHPDSLYELVMAVANNQLGKDELAEWFREHIEPVA